MTLRKPLPIITNVNRPYFEGCSQGVLRIQICRACQRHQFFPREVCAKCLSATQMDWVQASGGGEVVSFCMVERPQDPVFYPDVPICFAAVKLDEGPVMLGEIREAVPDAVRIGMRVEVGFLPISTSVTVPIWRPAQTS
jgi:uncharacterized OB-fold protein